jgi:nucleotide-binding universal stress UspA family protein
MILICYDGSEDARAAIAHAADLMPQQPATVLTVWQPFFHWASRASFGLGGLPTFPDSLEIDQASRDRAAEIAGEGSELAERAGLKSQATTCAQNSTIARAILGRAEELNADAIVMGSRGRSGVKSLVLGSVSHDVVQRADRAVVIVPSAEVAASRAGQISREAAQVSG